jgi:hypothetical protein
MQLTFASSTYYSGKHQSLDRCEHPLPFSARIVCQAFYLLHFNLCAIIAVCMALSRNSVAFLLPEDFMTDTADYGYDGLHLLTPQ